MLIHQVAELLGVNTDTIRYYEREGLLDDRHITRRPNGYRDYGDPAIDRLRLLLRARRTGLTISELKTLAAAYDDDTLTPDLQLTLLRDKLAALDRRARELDATRAALTAKIAALQAHSS